MDPFNKHRLATGTLKQEYVVMSDANDHQLYMHAEIITIIQLRRQKNTMSFSLYA